MIKKILIPSLIVLAALIILLLILAPRIAKRYTIKNSKELIGRQIDMDKLKLNYFTGLIRVTDFTMLEADDESKFVTFDTLTINLEPFQFFRDELVVESFYLKGLKLNVVQYDSTFNFDDLIDFHSSPEDSSAIDSSDSEPFRFQFSNIEINSADIVYDDHDIDKITLLKDISFFVPFIGWDQEEKSEAGLRFAFKNEGYFESSINLDPVKGDFEAEITIHHLYLNAFKEYMDEYININGVDGLYNSNIFINGNMNEPEKSLVSGYAEILDFKLLDKNDKKFLSAQKMECILKEIDVANNSFLIDSLILREPYVFFELDTASNNLSELFNPNPEESDATSEFEVTIVDSSNNNSTANPVYYAINSFHIERGVIDYTDNITGEPFNYHLSEIHLDADSIYSTSDWIDLYSEMMLNNRGALKAEVGLNPSNPLDIDLQYVITDFQLGDLNIYSRFYMGFPIVYGDMFYRSDTKISGGQLKSENELIIHNVELGEKSGGLYSLPLKFALFLLKDRDGVINLDVPVRGDLNNPKVTVGKIVWNTFKNLIVKVAASPFDLLAGLISVDPNDIKAIEYEYTDTTLTERRQEQLDLLLQLEEKKEGLRIELVYFNDLSKEKGAIAIRKVGEEFNNKTSSDYKENRDDFETYVRSQIENDSLDLSLACLQLAGADRIDSLSALYNRTRKEQIEKYLLSAVDSTNISTRIANPKAPKNVGSYPVFEVKYFMEDQIEQKVNEE